MAQKVHFFQIHKFIFLKMTPIGVILCRLRALQNSKNASDPDSGKIWVFEAKSVRNKYEKRHFSLQKLNFSLNQGSVFNFEIAQDGSKRTFSTISFYRITHFYTKFYFQQKFDLDLGVLMLHRPSTIAYSNIPSITGHTR
jgi:hypothetical protein